MIGLDSNILIRLATGESPAQAAACKAFVLAELSEERPGYVSTVALVEFCWTLRRIYKFSLGHIRSAVSEMLINPLLRLEREEAVAVALKMSGTFQADFPDALIAAIHRAERCEYTITLDSRFAMSGQARLLRVSH